MLRRWKLGMGHANGFWWKNWACTVLQPNLCPGSWQLTRSSSASTSALNFVSSPPTLKRSCPGSSLVVRVGFMVMTLRQSDSPPSGKAACQTGEKQSQEHDDNFLWHRGDCAQRICPKRPSVNSGFSCEVLRRLLENVQRHRSSPPTLVRTDLVASPWQRPISHFCPHPPVSGEKQNCCYPPPIILPWFGTLWLLPVSITEIEAERMPLWYHWGDPGRIAEIAWHSDRKGLPGSIPKMEETVGLVSTWGRELLQGWRWPKGLMVSFTIFTVSVRKILDQPMYIIHTCIWCYLFSLKRT